MNYQTISEYFGIDENRLDALGVFDRFIGIDTRLFIDPFLLDILDIPEFTGSREKVKERFNKVIKLLSISRDQKDLAFRGAVELLTFKEVRGVGIGYGKDTEDGNSIGPVLAKNLALTGKEIVDFGIKDPEIFELIGLFQENYGADRLSDLTINILKREFIEFTIRITKELNIDKIKEIKYGNIYVNLPYVEETGRHVLFLPNKALRDLPIAHDVDNIDHVVSVNKELRDRLNKLVGAKWKDYLKSKSHRREFLLNEKNIRQLVGYYKNKKPIKYNFNNDPKGEVKWKSTGKEISSKYPLNLSLPQNPDIGDLDKVVKDIIIQFKKNIEFNGVNKLFYTIDSHYGEEFFQKVFYVVADSYCKANNLDLTAEANGGRGPVDFKLSRGTEKIVVEVKHTSNPSFIKGIQKKLPIYQQSESAQGIFLAIQIDEAKNKLEILKKLKSDSEQKKVSFPEYYIIDARIKPSASKVK
jgi:hypothetical protein